MLVNKRICEALGLPETADEATILNAIAGLKGEKDTACNRLASAEAKLLQNREAQADADLEPVKDKLSEDDRKAIRAQLIANRAATLPLLRLAIARATPAAGAAAGRVPPGPKLDRSTARPPVDGAHPVVNRTVEICAAVDTIRNRDKCTHDDAFARARREKPELFKTETD